jgi:hypothetical protein
MIALQETLIVLSDASQYFYDDPDKFLCLPKLVGGRRSLNGRMNSTSRERSK